MVGILNLTKRAKVIGVVLFFFTCMPAFAKDVYQVVRPDPLTEKWRYVYFDELNDKGVRSVAKSAESDIYWFGVSEGVVRYDGVSRKFFGEKEGLPGGAALQVYAANNGSVYAATAKGIYRYSSEKWAPVFEAQPGESFSFHSLSELSNGIIVCALNEGAILLSGEDRIFISNHGSAIDFKANHPEFKWVNLPHEGTFGGAYDMVSEVFEYNDNTLWLAISKGGTGEILEVYLNEILNGSVYNFRSLKKRYNLRLGNNQKIFRASDGKIWVVNKSNKIGALTFHHQKWDEVSIGEKFGDDEYNVSISESEDGTIWIGGIGKIYSFNQSSWKKYSAPSFHIPATHITTYAQKNGELILLGHQSSVIKIDLSDQWWATYQGLNYQCETVDGATWFLDVNGKAIYNKGEEWLSYGRKDGLIEHPVRIFNTSQDQLWAMGSDRGVAAVAYLKDDKWHKIHFETLSWGIDYRAVLESADGSLWFGGSVDFDERTGQAGGLVQLFEDGSWAHHKYKSNGLQQSSVYGIGESRNGKIWIGGARLYTYDGKVWRQSDNEFLSQFVNVLYSDCYKNIYAGSRYYGVFVFDNQDWKHYSTANGLVSNTVLNICSDDEKMWVATDKDISFFDGKTWINHAFPQEMTLANEGGGININSKGEIWINHSPREWKRRSFNNRPVDEEINHLFKVFRKTPNHNPPETRITLYTEKVDNSGNTFIAWEAEDYQYHTPSTDLLYSYRLNSGEWSAFSETTNHTFTGLKNGSYTIEVRAMDFDGNIDPTPAIARFEVLPPVWKQTWFIVLIVGFLIMITIFEYRIITKNKKLSRLNLSLQEAVDLLEEKRKKIEKQNEEIVYHQKELEDNNQLLESKNHEIEAQRDALKDLVTQIESLSKAKVKFFTNITHEFRTPLSLILGPIESLTSSEVSSSERYNLYQIIKRNALRLQKLINQLLEIRRIETGTMELILRKENIVKFVRDIKELFNNQSAQKYIKFTFTSDVNEYNIYFDQDKIEKVVFNLLSNAFKYTREYGKISVSISVNNYDNSQYPDVAKDMKEYIVLKVKDTGRGIEESRLHTIFERFKSADLNLTISNMQSMGIGLSYIKELIEFHQGNIFVESKEGEGTTFTILIPKNLKPDKHLSYKPDDIAAFELSKSLDAGIIQSEEELAEINGKAEASSEKSNRYSLLIVEDNEDMRAYLTSLLKDEYHILSAENGRAGLERLAHEEVDLVISDIMMPELDGIMFCREVKANFETSHIPVILLTAKTMKESRVIGYESGADDYISKPFDPEILRLKVKNVFDTRENLKTKFVQDFKFRPKEVKVASADEKLMNRMVELMEEHISDPDFDVNKMCDMVNLSHMHFIRKVKQLTGKKPIDLLKSFRMQRAKQLLEQDKLNISEVAYMVGYDLPNSFSRAFKKEFGISPTEFVAESSGVGY